MDLQFKEIIKPLSRLFNVQEQTLTVWSKSDNRTAHRTLLCAAYQVLDACPQYRALLEAGKGPADVADILGLDNPMNITIPGVSARTFRTWFDKQDKHKLAVGILLGLHWQLLGEITERAGLTDPVLLIKRLAKKGITPGELVRLYRVSPDPLIKLIRV